LAFCKICLEIGFGYGEHLTKQALNHPDILFIGCDLFVNGIAALTEKIAQQSIKNIRIYNGDARELLNDMPNNFLDGVFLLFPDPWPKRKHIKRRFFHEDNIRQIYKKMKLDAFWRIASDQPDYQVWIKKILNLPDIQNMFKIAFYNSTTRPNEQTWPKTRYEQKAINASLFVELFKTNSL
jgi:tRNA (guanine-N7-)-methyltransferase